MRRVACRAEEPAVLLVFEQLALLLRQPDRQLQMAQIELRFVEIEQRLREERVVVQEARDRRVALRDSGAAARRFRIVHARDHEIRGAPRGIGIARLVQHRAA